MLVQAVDVALNYFSILKERVDEGRSEIWLVMNETHNADDWIESQGRIDSFPL